MFLTRDKIYTFFFFIYRQNTLITKQSKQQIFQEKRATHWLSCSNMIEAFMTSFLTTGPIRIPAYCNRKKIVILKKLDALVEAEKSTNQKKRKSICKYSNIIQWYHQMDREDGYQILLKKKFQFIHSIILLENQTYEYCFDPV